MSDNIPQYVPPGAHDAPTDRATFYGVHSRDITGHNQVAIPKPHKKVIDDAHEQKLLLVHWRNEPFLRLYTKKQFDQKVDEVKRNSEIPPQERAPAAKRIARAAEPIEPDGQGRFVLPSKWVQALGFKDKVIFSGVFTFVEVWPAHAFRGEDEAPEAREPETQAQTLTNILDM